MNTVTDWSKIKANVDGVILRIGYRGYGKSGNLVLDKKFKGYQASAQGFCIPMGYYFFPTSITDDEAKAEADFVYKVVKPLPQKYPVYLDSEYSNNSHNGRSDKLSRENRTRFLKIILDRLKGYGISCGAYGSTSWLNTMLNMSDLSGYPVWVAQYAKKCTYTGKFVMWQFTDAASVPGVQGRCDMSYLYDDTVPVMSPYAIKKWLVSTIKTGSTGESVRFAQKLLVAEGYSLITDGIFGQHTDTAVKSYQKTHKLTADGIIGPKTWESLLSKY